jgi:hypothetical protein
MASKPLPSVALAWLTHVWPSVETRPEMANHVVPSAQTAISAIWRIAGDVFVSSNVFQPPSSRHAAPMPKEPTHASAGPQAPVGVTVSWLPGGGDSLAAGSLAAGSLAAGSLETGRDASAAGAALGGSEPVGKALPPHPATRTATRATIGSQDDENSGRVIALSSAGNRAPGYRHDPSSCGGLCQPALDSARPRQARRSRKAGRYVDRRVPVGTADRQNSRGDRS